MYRKGFILSIVLFALILAPAAYAEVLWCEDPAPPQRSAPDDREALRDVSVGRILWDVTLGDPQLLLGRLGVIEQTYHDMVRQRVAPEMIFAFRGGAVRLLAADLETLAPEQRDVAAQVQSRLRALVQLDGVRMESCYIAMQRVPLEPADLMDGVAAVGNTFLSAMGYGQKGFVSIPIN